MPPFTIMLDAAAPAQTGSKDSNVTSDCSAGGYVLNGVYTCGAVARHDTLVVPHGIVDQTIAIATLSITELLDAMTPEPRR